jgi:3-phenylpropionate/cinnamic acid dioxygenase small subunit
LEEQFDKEIKKLKERNKKQLTDEDPLKKEFLMLNQTIEMNDVRTRMMGAAQKVKESIKMSKVKIEVNNMEIDRLDSEIIDLKTRMMIYRYKLKEMYKDLMKNPKKLL